MKYLTLLLTLIVLFACEAPPPPEEESKKQTEKVVVASTTPQIYHSCDTSVAEGDNFYCDLGVTDSDSVVHEWSIHGFNTCTWASINSVSGVVSGLITNGSDCQLVVLVEDDRGEASSLVIHLDVDNAINDTPVTSGTCSSTVAEGGSYSCSVTTVDEDDFSFTYSLHASNTCSWATFADPSVGTVTGTPTTGGSSCTLAFRAMDDSGSYSNVISTSVTITESSNDAPIITASCSATGSEGSAYSCTFSANDEENDSLTYALDASNTCTWASFPSSTSPTVSGTATVGGDCLLAFVANDGTTDSAVYSLTVSITDTFNDTPTITQSCNASPNESANYSCTFTGYDEEGVALTYAIDDSNTCTWAKIEDSSSPVITGMPLVGGEACTLAFTATDGNSTSAVASVAVTVVEAYNDPPYIAQHCPITGQEDVPWSCTFSTYDEESAAMTYEMAPSNTCTWADFDDNTVPTISRTATAGGTCTMAVRAHDGTQYSPTRSFTVTIEDITNDIPVITQACSNALNEGDQYACLFSAYDEEGANLTYHLHASNTCDWAKILDENTPLISGSPTAGEICNIVFYATDGETVSVNSVVAVTVTDTFDDPPTAHRYITCSSTATEGTMYYCYIIGNDEEGAALNLHPTIGPECSGWLNFTDMGFYGAFSGNPPDGNATCSFSMYVDDGGQNSNTVSVNLNILEGENDAPTISETCATTIKAGETYVCEFTAADEDVGDSITFGIDSANNTCYGAYFPNPAIPTVVYHPSYVGSCDLSFYVTDGEIQTTIASPITITISTNDELGLDQITSGEEFTCGLTAAGKAYCWGANSFGQLGNGTNISSKIPVEVDMSAFPDTYFKQISAGSEHACGVAGNGSMYCWGRNASGQLGNGTTTNSYTPVLVDVSANSYGGYDDIFYFKQVEAGNNFTCGLSVIGVIFCWGTNEKGQLGNDDMSVTFSAIPVVVPFSHIGPNREAIQITTGYDFACALSANGRAMCWGSNEYGQLGNESSDDSSARAINITFDDIEDRYAHMIKIAAGYGHVCGITSAGKGICWGKGDQGQLGDGNSNSSPDPVFVKTEENYSYHVSTYGYGHFIEITAGSGFSCAIDSLGNTFCWGTGAKGQLGNATYNSYDAPILVYDYYFGDFVKIDSGRDHSCGFNAEGKGYCWGEGSRGQLGHYVQTSSSYPIYMHMNDIGESPNLHFSTLSEGLDYHVCARSSNGKSYCWGDNSDNQLGLNEGVPSNKSSPQEVSIISNLKFITTGNQNTCGITSSGVVNCWGLLDTGEAGRGNYDDSSSTARPIISTYWTSDDNFFTLSMYDSVGGLTGSGKGYSWGSNSSGQLGVYSPGEEFPLDSAVPYSMNYYIAGSSGENKDIKTLSKGYNHGCLILGSGLLRCWGDNTYGQLGVTAGSPTISQTPISTSSPYTFQQVSAGYNFNCALNEAGIAKCWGRNNYGQLGDGTSPTDAHYPDYIDYSPMQTDNESIAFTQISTGLYHACGVTGSGKVYCWGYNSYGQLGDGSYTTRDIPTEVNMSAFVTDNRFEEVRAYRYSTCGITSSGKAYCWGYGFYGQLGNNSTSTFNTPQQVDMTP